MEKVFGERRYYLSNTYSDNSFSDTFKNILLLTSTMDYDLELNKIIETVKKNKYKTVLLQLPDGLKPKAKDIVDLILLAKRTVLEKFDINLELEIKTLGFSTGTFEI